jgi:protein-S-isoprenylcysteine O-methyltransferase Ste14
VAPTENLVVGGLYRHVRNPMYLAVGATIVGQALVLAQPVLFVYAAIFAVMVVAFVRGYEEPTLRRQFGEEYERYRRAVPGWWPRRTPWRGR